MIEPEDHFKSWDPNFSTVGTEDDYCPYFGFDSDLSLVLQTRSPSLPGYQVHQMQYLQCAMEDFHSIESSGYLQDVIDWTDRCKRPRMLCFPPEDSQTLITTWSSSCSTQSEEYTEIFQEELEANLSWFTQDSFSNTVSDLLPSCNSEENVAVSTEKEVVISTPDEDDTEWARAKPITPEGEKSLMEKKRKKEQAVKVAYPFAVVKPNGVQGDLTLRDINRKILKRPTRPIQHPVGEFASLPSHVSSGGSGKVITAHTRIRTQGKGTITIIRTRG